LQKGRPTQNKRQRERAQADRRQQKAQRRQASKARRAASPRPEGEDPDLAGIRPGPQPNPYGDDDFGDETTKKDE
jgi:hypothetical protein